MKILILQDKATEHPSPAEELLDLEYSNADRIWVADPKSLETALEEGGIDLVVLEAPMSRLFGAGILRLIRNRYPGLSVIWMTPEQSATQKTLEQELRHSRSSFDNLFNTPTDLILIIDNQHRVLAANQAFYTLSGARPEEVIGRSTREYMPPGLAERRDAALRQVFETGQALRFEDRGVSVWLDITIYPVRDSQGDIGHVVVYAHDITERKLLEDTLQQSYKTIDALLNAPSDLILLLDRQTRLVRFNQTFRERFAKTSDELIGRSLMDILPAQLAQDRTAIIQQVFESGKGIRFEDHGVTGWFDNSVYPILNDQNQVEYVAVVARDITERKLLEENLVQSHNTINALLNIPTDMIVLLDRQGKIALVNQTTCQRFNIGEQDLLGKSLSDILPPDTAQARYAMVEQVFKTGQAVRFEDLGVTGWLDHSVYPILDDQNQVNFVAVVSRDISDRKRLEEILRRDQRTMLAMANAPNDIYVLLDLDGTILQANEVIAQSLGRTPEEMIGLCLWDMLPRPVADFRRSVFERVVQTGQAERVEDQGRLGIYDSRVIPVVNDQGEVVQVAILARDITDRKRIENALRESEERYRTLVETSPDGIVYYEIVEGTEGRLAIANQHFAALFGYENADELIQHKPSPSDLIAEQDQPLLMDIIQRGFQYGAIHNANLVARRKDGSTFQLEANAAMVCDQQGKPKGFIGICRDVTERNSLQEELFKSYEMLEHRVVERTAELQAMNRQMRKEVYLRQQAEAQWRHQALYADALARVASSANAQLELKAILGAICKEIVKVLPYPVSGILLYNEQSDTFTIDHYASLVDVTIEQVPPIPRALLEEYIHLHGSIHVIPDARSLPAGGELIARISPDIQTVINIGLHDEGKLIGLLSMASVNRVQLPSDDELDLFRAISNQAALSITKARLFERVLEGQARLKALTERLVEVQEEEIRKVARELHDEIGQMLTSLSLNLEIIGRSIEAGVERPSLQEEVSRAREQVKQLLNQVRDLSLKLLPTMLDDLGLLPALLDHCQRFTAQTGIQVEVAHRGLGTRLPAKLETAAYRIVQEALTNVARHAGVKQADVRLWLTASELGIQVEDQGAGFDLQQVESNHRSSGISSMRERAANCGGSLEIESAPGKGTCLTVEFPIGPLGQIARRK